MPIQEMIAIKNSGDTEANLSLLMAMHCAPLLKKLAIANVLTLSKEEAEIIRRLLKRTEISCRILCKKADKVILYLYRKKELQAYLQSEEIKNFLEGYGYSEEKMLERLAERIAFYSDSQVEFPHEIGVFLGYPLPDVKSFIEHRGSNCIHIGYWKVYHNVQETIKLFERFDEERRLAVREVVMGRAIWEIAV